MNIDFHFELFIEVVYHNMSVGSWLFAEAQIAFFSASFGEIAWLFWGKFLNFGFSSIHRQ